jgi:Uma2 family endonuclease
MAEPSPSVVEDEHDLYPVHEEDSVPETPRHFWQVRDLAGVLQIHRPQVWVTGDTCLYWERGNTKRYVAPDIAVIACSPPADPKTVYLAWHDPPLVFVVEVGSRSTIVADTGPKVATFERSLKVPEYLYADPPRGDLRLWRMVEGTYHTVAPDERGRLWSAQLELWFGYDAEGELRAYDAAGELLLNHDEERQRRLDAERRLAAMAEELDRLRRQTGG